MRNLERKSNPIDEDSTVILMVTNSAKKPLIQSASLEYFEPKEMLNQ